MYEAHFGFRANPFRIAPDPKFFFASAGHKRGLAYMRYGLHQGQGFVVVTGEPGTGKTMLIHTLLSELSNEEYSIANITSTNLRAEDVLRAVAENFGIDQRSALNKAELLTFIQKFLVEQHEAGKKSLMIVDEAQNLPPRSLEELRMLSNFQIGHEGLLQIILAGQPQLRKTLAAPSMEQLSQRIIAGCHLKPISSVETRGYIMHRLTRAGWAGKPNFTSEGLSLIFQISRGIPRLINVLVDRLLLSVCLEEESSVDEARVRAVLAELQDESANVWMGSVEDYHADSSLAPLPELASDEEQPMSERARRRELSPASVTPSNHVPSAPPRRSSTVAASSVSAVSREAVSEEHAEVQDEVAEPAKVAAVAKVRSKIVKAVGGRAAQLVQMKAPKDEAAAKAAKRQIKKQPVKAEKPAKPSQPKPQRRAARDEASAPVALPQKPKAPTNLNVIELPVKSRAKAVPPPMAPPEPAAIPNNIAIPDITEPDIDLTAETATDYGQPFGEAKSRFTLSPLMKKIGLASGLVVGSIVVVSYFLFSGPAAIEPAQLAQQQPQPMEQATPPRTPMPTAPAVSESSRASLFDPRESVAVSDRPTPEPSSVGAVAEVSSLPPIPEPAVLEGAIPEWELADLVYTYILAYENGNLSLFNTLFTDDVVVAGRIGRDAVVSYHDVLFNSTEMRSMSMNSIKWSWRDDVLHGIGMYDMAEWKTMGADPKMSSGRVTIEVRKLGSRYQVSKVEYL